MYCIVFYFTVFLFYFFSVEYFGVGECVLIIFELFEFMAWFLKKI